MYKTERQDKQNSETSLENPIGHTSFLHTPNATMLLDHELHLKLMQICH